MVGGMVVASGQGAGLADRVAAFARGRGMAVPGEPVLVALSGGIDSAVLLHLLRFTLGRDLGDPVAASFDHRMRPGSAQDLHWVRGLCRVWGIRLQCAAAESVPTSEAQARAMRYAFLRDAARSVGAARIFTAHHADDQAETVLFRLLRGTGSRGLAGIPARRGAVCRPLLPFRKAEIEAYARAWRVPFRDDPTNRDLRYARNVIRHVLLPSLESLAPGATDTVLELAGAARALEDRWEAVLDRVLEDVVNAYHEGAVELARKRLLAYDAGVVARVVRLLLRRFGSRPGRAGTRTALEFIISGASGGHVMMPNEVEVARDFDRIRIGWRDPGRRGADRPAVIEAPQPGASDVLIGGRAWTVQWGPTLPDGPGASAAFVKSELRFPLTVRGWESGDRIRLGYGAKKLKKLFGERRVPVAIRHSVPLLVDAGGEVLWVVSIVRGVTAQPAATGNFQVRVVDDAEHG